MTSHGIESPDRSHGGRTPTIDEAAASLEARLERLERDREFLLLHSRNLEPSWSGSSVGGNAPAGSRAKIVKVDPRLPRRHQQQDVACIRAVPRAKGVDAAPPPR